MDPNQQAQATTTTGAAGAATTTASTAQTGTASTTTSTTGVTTGTVTVPSTAINAVLNAAAQQPAGAPDQAQKLARIERERDDYKAKWEAAQAAEQAKADLEAQLADARKRAAVDVALASKGCLDLQMARAAIDLSKLTVKDDGSVEGFDADEFAKAKPFLFHQTQAAATVSTGAPQGGSEPPKQARTIKEGLAATRKERS